MSTGRFRLTNRSDRPVVIPSAFGAPPLIVPPARDGVPGSIAVAFGGIVEEGALDGVFASRGVKAAIDAGDLIAEATHSIRLRNTTGHALMVLQRKGVVLSVPPASEAPNGVEFDLIPAERDALDSALATPTVQGWIAAGDLVLDAPRPQPQP